MTDTNQRIQAIIERTRKAFLQDSVRKSEEIRKRFGLWRNRAIDPGLLVGTVYDHVHGMIGLALTLSYEEIDRCCREILDFIVQQEDRAWTAPQLERLEELTGSLGNELKQLKSA